MENSNYIIAVNHLLEGLSGPRGRKMIEQHNRSDRSGCRQIIRVLRMGVGSRVLAFNGSGHEWEVEIATSSPREVVGRIVAEVSMARESPLRVVLLQGLLKGDKMDYLIQKVTEMGVAEVVLLGAHSGQVVCGWPCC